MTAWAMRRVSRDHRTYWLVWAGDLPGDARCVLATWDAATARARLRELARLGYVVDGLEAA